MYIQLIIIITIIQNRPSFNFSSNYENVKLEKKEKWWVNPDLPQTIHG